MYFCRYHFGEKENRLGSNAAGVLKYCIVFQYYTILSSLIYTSSIGTPTDMSASPEDSDFTEGQTHSPEEALENTSNAAAIGGGVGGSVAAIIIAALIVAVVLLVRNKQHLEAGLHHLHYIYMTIFF